jgi:RimJ/RimL family protein N-acetyltransferase
MMDNILNIVPYISKHGKIILANQMNHVLMDQDAKFDGEAMQLEEKGLAYTCMINDEPIASAGMKIIWDGVAEGWVLASHKVWQHPLPIARAIKKNFARLAKEHKIKRVQTAVRADFKIGLKFAKWLGLENEGLMKHYGFDGSDHFRYARIF